MVDYDEDEYARLLREGKTEEATALVTEKESEDEEVVEDEKISEQERFAELKGVGDATAEDFVNVFGTFEAFKDASVEEVAEVEGFGEKSAEDLLEQVE